MHFSYSLQSTYHIGVYIITLKLTENIFFRKRLEKKMRTFFCPHVNMLWTRFCPFTFASADMFLSAVDGQMRTTIGPLKVKFRRRTTAWPAKSLAVDTFMSVRQILIWTKCCPCRNTHGHVRVRPRVGH